MKYIYIPILALVPYLSNAQQIPEPFKKVQQVVWVVNDIDQVIREWQNLGFNQIQPTEKVRVIDQDGNESWVKLALANLGGAHVTWIQPLEGESIFTEFLASNGNGAMSLVHLFNSSNQLKSELERLSKVGVNKEDEISMFTENGPIRYTFMDTKEKGKYVLGFITGDTSTDLHKNVLGENHHHLKINQYAFAIENPEEVSAYWAKIGLPEFQINHPELVEPKYYGKLVNHELIQGWQRHGNVDYEWCIPVKNPIVYEDHIKLHGEGIHHLAFSVDEMDQALEDYCSKGYVVTMGGAWGEKDKPGSGRYEYIGLEKGGGVTMELLWNDKE